MYRFTKTHLVANDATDLLGVQLPHPLHSCLLIVEERGIYITGDVEPAFKDRISPCRMGKVPFVVVLVDVCKNGFWFLVLGAVGLCV